MRGVPISPDSKRVLAAVLFELVHQRIPGPERLRVLTELSDRRLSIRTPPFEERASFRPSPDIPPPLTSPFGVSGVRSQARILTNGLKIPPSQGHHKRVPETH